MKILKTSLVILCLLCVSTTGSPQFDGGTFFMGKMKDMTGHRAGRWSVVRFSHMNIRNSAMWLCRCDCGNEAIVWGADLRNGNSQSCGCSYKFHNMTGTPLFSVWLGMKARCYAPNRRKTGRYEDRGIVVCEEWKDDFMAFYDWAVNNGYERGLELDRRDNNGIYRPSNCRFVTRVININNRENTVFVKYRGETLPIAILIRRHNLMDHFSTIKARIIRRGWDIDLALTTPIRKLNRK